MNPRTKIPAMALLGLSCSQCTERSSDGVDALVGEWEAIEIDGEKFPIVETGPTPPPGEGQVFAARRGWDLHVSAELGSTLAYFQEYGYGAGEGQNQRYEFYSGLEIDDSAAPKYRLAIQGDLVHFNEGEEPYTSGVASITATGYADTGYAGTGTGTGYGSDTGYSPSTGGLDEDELAFDEFERDLVEGTHPVFAAGMILDCELKAEQLHCVRQVGAGDDGKDRVWTFARVVEEE